MKLSINLLFLICFTVVLNAQSSDTLTIDEAVGLAFQYNTSVIQTGNNVRAANSGLLAAYGRYLPTVSALGSWSRTANRRVDLQYEGVTIPIASTSTSNDFRTNIGLGYTIFDGFQRESNFRRASSNASSADYNATRTRQSIRYLVESAYLNVLRQEQLVKVAEENLKRDERQLERITESNRVGALSLADVYRQQSQVAADELNVIDAQNAYDKAKADLVALIGLDMTRDYRFSDKNISVVIDPSEIESTKDKYKDLNGLAGRALESRTDYLAAKENLDASEAAVTAAWGGYLPSVSASAGYSLSNEVFENLNDNRSLTWGISLRWNIFDGFLTNQEVQTAAVTKKNSEEDVKQAERGIYVEVKKALLDLESRIKQVEVSQKGLISATEDRKIAEERYNLGAGTLLDLLIANTGFVNAQANNINSAYFYITAKRNIEYVLGERKE